MRADSGGARDRQQFRRWRLEDGLGETRVRALGAFLLLLGAACFLAANALAWRFFLSRGGDAGGSSSRAGDSRGYYALLVPVTLPATVVFVYLNWLAVSIFKSA
jgi:phosphatidylinositol glycan anchor class Y biosynthesis protein